MRFHSYLQFTEHLDSLGLFRMKPGLGRMREFLDAMGPPVPGTARVQVVGTNGKGTTCAFLAALATAHGLRAGLYTSPHFVSLRERLRLDGRTLPREEWTGLANEVYALCPDTDFSYFELLTCMAHLGLSQGDVDLAVLETGLGGTYDAVTALPADLVVFTPIGLDHCDVLGRTLGAVARDKAGAVRPRRPVVASAQADGARQPLALAASARNAPLFPAGDVLNGRESMDLDFLPGFLRDNARTALAAWLILCDMRAWTPDPEACSRALRETAVPGRMQIIPGDPGLILDGAHNPDGLAALKRALDEAGLRPGALVFACLADKDVSAMADLARDLAAGPIHVPALAVEQRGVDPEILAARLGPRAQPHASTASALDAALAGPGPVLIAGSLYLLAEMYTHQPWLLHPEPSRDAENEPSGGR